MGAGTSLPSFAHEMAATQEALISTNRGAAAEAGLPSDFHQAFEYQENSRLIQLPDAANFAGKSLQLQMANGVQPAGCLSVLRVLIYR